MDGRWRFLDERNADEARRRAEMLKRIDAWWREMARRQEDLRSLFKNQSKWDLPNWMAQHLQAIHPKLMWEFGTAIAGEGHRLVITPECEHHLRPLVTTILERAPRLDGWEFYDHRLPEDARMAQLTVETRSGGDLSDVTVRGSRANHNRVDLTFISPRTTGGDDRQALNDAFVAVETLLGEKTLDRWVGEVNVARAPTPPILGRLRGEPTEPPGLPLDALRPTVDALIVEIRASLSPEPHYKWASNAGWTILKLQPKQADEYPGQRDLFVAKTINMAQWQAAHGPCLFYDERFSQTGEVFAYVKIDGTEGLAEASLKDKSEIEDAIDAVLIPAGLGCHIGGGSGVRYAYIDLALADVQAGVDAICARLREGRVPRRSWIQFFCSDWSREWVGVYPDSPPPPFEVESE